MTDFTKLCQTCAHVFLYEDFNMESAKKLKTDIDDACDKVAKEKLQGLILHISSYGGEVYACYYLFNILASLSLSVYTVIDGAAFSAGAFLFMIGKERFMFENSLILFHGLHTTIKNGTLRKTSAERLLERIKLFDKKFIQMIRSKADISDNDMEKMLKTDKILGCEKALHYKFASKIIYCEKSDTRKAIGLTRSIGRSDISQPLDNLKSTISTMLSASSKSEPIRLLLGFDDPTLYTTILPLCNYLSFCKNAVCTAVAPCNHLETIVLMSAAHRLAFSFCHLELLTVSNAEPNVEVFTDTISNNKLVENLFKKIIKSRASIPSATLKIIEKNTIYLDPEKALQWNIIDGIIPSTK